MKKSRDILFITLGWLCLGLGVLGAFLPILPTTPFVLLCGYFFSQGSPKLHAWLLERKFFGPIIRDWESHGVVGLRAKVMATILMTALFSYTLIFVKIHIAFKTAAVLCGLSVLLFLWSRPSARKIKDNEV